LPVPLAELSGVKDAFMGSPARGPLVVPLIGALVDLEAMLVRGEAGRSQGSPRPAA
jgi:hypothetical protein